MVVPEKPLHLIWGKKRMGKWTVTLVIGQNGYPARKTRVSPASIWKGFAGAEHSVILGRETAARDAKG